MKARQNCRLGWICFTLVSCLLLTRSIKSTQLSITGSDSQESVTEAVNSGTVRVEVSADSVVMEQKENRISQAADPKASQNSTKSEDRPPSPKQSEVSINQSEDASSGDLLEKQPETLASEAQSAETKDDPSHDIRAKKLETPATQQEPEKEPVKPETESANNKSALQLTDDNRNNSSISAQMNQSATGESSDKKAEQNLVTDKKQIEADNNFEEEKKMVEKQEQPKIQPQKSQQHEQQQKAKPEEKQKIEKDNNLNAEQEKKRLREKEALEKVQREKAEQLEKEKKDREEKENQASEKQRKDMEAKEAKQREEKARLERIANEKAAQSKSNQKVIIKPKQAPSDNKPQANESSKDTRGQTNNLGNAKDSDEATLPEPPTPQPQADPNTKQPDSQKDILVDPAVKVPSESDAFAELSIDKQGVPADAVQNSLIDTAGKKDDEVKVDQASRPSSLLLILDTCYHSLKLLLCSNPYIQVFFLACFALNLFMRFIYLIISALTSDGISDERIVRFFSIIKNEFEDGSRSLKTVKSSLPINSLSAVSKPVNQASSASLSKRIDSLNAALKDIVADYKKYCPLFEKPE